MTRLVHHLILAIAGVSVVLSALASTSSEPRRLRFAHTHTGERLEITYFNDGKYDATALLEIDHLLRDFRTGEAHSMDPQLLDLLWDLQTALGREAEFEIIGGYRSPATNEMLRQRSSGVAEHSQHMLGKAIDLRVKDYPTLKLAEAARALARGGVGYYAASDFVHIDTGRVRTW